MRSESAEAFAAAYAQLLETVRALPIFSGFCYTQFADTYQEANGLLDGPPPKIPLEIIAEATRGKRPVLAPRRPRRRSCRSGTSRPPCPAPPTSSPESRSRGISRRAGAPMHERSLVEPDGRRLILYSARPIPDGNEAVSPATTARPPNAHLRWHPLRGEWVAYARHRQKRTFLPPPEYNPLAPTTDPAHPTELPAGDYDVAVFENLFPTLTESAHDPPAEIVPTRPARGSCEVVVFTQDPTASLGSLPLPHIELLFEVWADRYRKLGAREDIEYVFPFENRGVEVGVTLSHPHGQIYAYPFVPPIPARELAEQLAHRKAHGRGLLEDLIRAEIEDGRRLLYAGPRAVAFLPVCARYAYEVWVAPRRAAISVADVTPEERADLARALKTVLLKYDRLWSKPFPYVLVFHQAPTDGHPHPEAHLHLEFYPPLRMEGRLKYLAGSELGAGTFTADTLPEDKAAELRAIDVSID